MHTATVDRLTLVRRLDAWTFLSWCFATGRIVPDVEMIAAKDKGAHFSLLTALRRRLLDVAAKSQKLLEAHHADAIAIDHLKAEQDRLSVICAEAERTRAQAFGGSSLLAGKLDNCMVLIARIGTTNRPVIATTRSSTRQSFSASTSMMTK